MIRNRGQREEKEIGMYWVCCLLNNLDPASLGVGSSLYMIAIRAVLLVGGFLLTVDLSYSRKMPEGNRENVATG